MSYTAAEAHHGICGVGTRCSWAKSRQGPWPRRFRAKVVVVQLAVELHVRIQFAVVSSTSY